MFEHEAAESHRETFPARAEDYGYTIRPKLERAQDVKRDEVEAAYAAPSGHGGGTSRPSTSTSRHA